MSAPGSSVYTLLYGEKPAQLVGMTRDERTSELLAVIRVKGDAPAFLRIVHPSKVVSTLLVDSAPVRVEGGL